MAEQPPGPREPSDEPRFAPVVFDDDSLGMQPPEPDDGGEGGLLKALGLILALGVVIVALVAPGSPVRVVGGGDGETTETNGIPTRARGDMPDLPEGLVALSRLYDIELPEAMDGRWSLSVPLEERETDGSRIALYRHDGERWHRIAAARLVDGGNFAEADVDDIPPNVAALRRTGVAVSLGLLVGPGAAPDGAIAADANVVAVRAASPALPGEEGGATVEVEAGALDAAGEAADPSADLYLGVTAGDEEARDAMLAALASPEAVESHAADLAAAAAEAGAAGIHLDYRGLPADQRDRFTMLVTLLDQALEDAGMGLTVAVPAPPAADAASAYDWTGLAEAADSLWLYGPDDPSAYYSQVESALRAAESDGVDLTRVWLVVDRASSDQSREGVRTLPLRDALAWASTFSTDPGPPVEPGQAVDLSGLNIDPAEGSSPPRWDDTARAVRYSYVDRAGPHTVWLQNRFSVAFRLDLAARYGLGGVVVADAQADEALPDVWDVVMSFVQDAAVELLKPYGPYLAPCWQASGGAIEGQEGGCWQAEAGEGAGAAVWRAPEQPGVYEVTLVVSEGTTFVGQRLTVRVGEAVAEEERPVSTPEPTAEPTQEPTPEPTGEPTPEPTVAPTEEPTVEPTEEPTEEPTVAPTEDPTAAATEEPTATGTPAGPVGNE